jgi:hypothetical protein
LDRWTARLRFSPDPCTRDRSFYASVRGRRDASISGDRSEVPILSSPEPR